MTRIELAVPTPDGTCPTTLHVPAADGPWPGVILFPDAAGVRETSSDMADRLAGLGYAVLLPGVDDRDDDPDAPHRLAERLAATTVDAAAQDRHWTATERLFGDVLG